MQKNLFVALKRLSLGLYTSMAIALCGANAAAQTVKPEDARAIQTVVRAQLDAFAADDATQAFSFAAPNIRDLFVTSERFLSMVRNNYPVVYRPASVAFLTPKGLDDDLVQPVYMRDGKGVSWLVMYTLRRQPDASWRISACVLAPTDARVASISRTPLLLYIS
jgi:hypothetical protein